MKKVTIKTEDYWYLFEIEVPIDVDIRITENGLYINIDSPFLKRYLDRDGIEANIIKKLQQRRCTLDEVVIEKYPSNSCKPNYRTLKFYKKIEDIKTVGDTLEGMAAIIDIFGEY